MMTMAVGKVGQTCSTGDPYAWAVDDQSPHGTKCKHQSNRSNRFDAAGYRCIPQSVSALVDSDYSCYACKDLDRVVITRHFRGLLFYATIIIPYLPETPLRCLLRARTYILFPAKNPSRRFSTSRTPVPFARLFRIQPGNLA